MSEGVRGRGTEREGERGGWGERGGEGEEVEFIGYEHTTAHCSDSQN